MFSVDAIIVDYVFNEVGSKSEAKRMIHSRAVDLNGKVSTNPFKKVEKGI